MPNLNEPIASSGAESLPDLNEQIASSGTESLPDCSRSVLGKTDVITASPCRDIGEIARLSELIAERSISWANQARALKFEMEFQAVEQERKRIAKELHDEALPLLARLQRTVSQSIEPCYEQDGDRNRCRGSDSESASESGSASGSGSEIGSGNGSELIQLSTELHKVTQCLRDLLGELHPVDLYELGLVAALDGLCQRYSRAGLSRLTFRSHLDDCPLSELQQLSIYRAIQLVLKAVSNVSECRLRVSFEQSPERIGLSISSQSENFSIAGFFLQELAESAIDRFFAWCSIAGAQVELSPAGIAAETEKDVFFSALKLCEAETQSLAKFPCALILSIDLPKLETGGQASITSNAFTYSIGELEQERIEELSVIVSHVQEEWARLAGKDLSVVTTVAVAVERQRLLGEIERLVSPALRRTRELLSVSSIESPDLDRRLCEVERAVANSIARIYPPELDAMSILALVSLLVARFERATLIKTRLIAGDAGGYPLTTEAKLSTYRIVQELLHNIEKHAAASTALVLVEQREERLLVCIEDDGIGCSGESGRHSRGIRTIQERAKEIGAGVSWQKSISYASGTLVTITIPACGIRQSSC